MKFGDRANLPASTDAAALNNRSKKKSAVQGADGWTRGFYVAAVSGGACPSTPLRCAQDERG